MVWNWFGDGAVPTLHLPPEFRVCEGVKHQWKLLIYRTEFIQSSALLSKTSQKVQKTKKKELICHPSQVWFTAHTFFRSILGMIKMWKMWLCSVPGAALCQCCSSEGQSRVSSTWHTVPWPFGIWEFNYTPQIHNNCFFNKPLAIINFHSQRAVGCRVLCPPAFLDSFIYLRDANTAQGWQDSAMEHKLQILVPDEWDAANFRAPHQSCCD